MFKVALDTMADDLFVPSAKCSQPCYPPTKRKYDSSKSSTYLEHGGSASSKWAGMSFSGPLSYDTIHLGDNNVTTFLFEEWTSASCYSIGCMNSGYDGVIGLAPPWSVKYETRPNILSTLLSQKTLDAPIFSLKLPTGLHEEGEILFGGMNSTLNSSTLINLPLVNVTQSHFSNRWTVRASNISFASPRPLEFTLPTHGFAVLDSGDPYLIIPGALARNLTAAIGAKPGPAWFHNIPCERRQELPLLTFTLNGYEFSISAFEYTLEIDPPHVGKMCITTFMEADEFLFPKDWEGIVLGSPFLRGFYSVWDFEKGSVGREYYGCPPAQNVVANLRRVVAKLS